MDLMFEVSLFHQFIWKYSSDKMRNVYFRILLDIVRSISACCSFVHYCCSQKHQVMFFFFFFFLDNLILFSNNCIGIYVKKIITSSSCVTVAQTFGQTTIHVSVFEERSSNRMRSSKLICCVCNPTV